MAGADDTGNLTFEQAMGELENLVARMESGKLPLDELIANYERGNRLAAFCRSKLETLERRIELLTADDGGGGRWTEFDGETPAGGRHGAAATAAEPSAPPLDTESGADNELPF